MSRIMRSILGWASFISLMVGGYVVYSGLGLTGLGLNMNKIISGVLIIAIAFLLYKFISDLGWNSAADISFVIQLFKQKVTHARDHSLPEAKVTIEQAQKRTASIVRPPLKLQRHLLALSLYCIVFAFALQMIEQARSNPSWGHTLLDTITYILMGIAAFFYCLRLLLDLIFFLRGRK